MNKQSIPLPGQSQQWGSYISKYQPDATQVLDNMFTAGSKNFVTDQTGMIDKRQGGVKWNRTNFGNVAKDTYEAVFESGARHFLRVGAGILSASTGTGLFDVITSGYSPVGNFEWATYQNRVYGDNGINAPQVYDIVTSYGGVSYSFTTGKTKVMGAQAPLTAPTSGAYTAGGLVPVGSHTYKITFEYYESEESNGSPASVVQTATLGNQTGHLSNIPIGGYGVTGRNIYRDNNDGVWLLLDTINDNTTTTYTDVLAQGSTPTPIPTSNDVPPSFTKIALWLDSLWIAPTGNTNVVQFSNAGQPDIFDPGNFVTCQSDDVVTALYVYQGKLYVFGLHSVGTIEGTTPDTFFYRNLNNFIGCVDNRSIQVRSIVSVPTLWWLSTKGFYYSNGYTVEYGSDFIQDLVNLNISQVNFTTGKNTQQTFADFSSDTSSPGVDVNTIPGEINTLNPKQVYSTESDWEGGLSLTNIKTFDAPLLEVPTQFAPTLAQGTLGGDGAISGTNVVIGTVPAFTGENFGGGAQTNPQPNASSGSFPGMDPHFGLVGNIYQRFTPVNNGTLLNLQMPPVSLTYSSHTFAPLVHIVIRNDGFGVPGGTVLFDQVFNLSTTGNTLIFNGGGFLIFLTTVQAPGAVTVNLVLTGGTNYWIGYENVDNGDNLAQIGINSVQAGTAARAVTVSGHFTPTSNQACTNMTSLAANYTYSSTPTPDAGSWTSQIYDSGGTTAIGAFIIESGSYPASTAGTLTLAGSPNPDMSGSTTQVVSNPNGTTVVTLSGFRYWQITLSLSTSDNTITPTMGTPLLQFNTVGVWISQPINATTDNTGWATLSFTGSVPFGTTVLLEIATSANNITYSSFGPIGSAVTQPWAKVRATLTTDAPNVLTPALSSITLTWALTSQIESTPIDAGTIPTGFGVVQWNQPTAAGTVTFYVRTATTALGLSSATYVLVTNGNFPALTPDEFMQWKFILMATADNTPTITSVTLNWFTGAGAVNIRVASLFFNKTYYVSLGTVGSASNDTLIQLDQFGNWRIQKDASIGTLLLYSNTLFFTDGVSDKIFNGFIAATDDGAAIAMDVRTKAWSAVSDLFLKVPRALKVTGINTGATIHAYYSFDRGATWIEMLNEDGVMGFTTDLSQTEFVVLFVPDGSTLTSGRTLMYRITSVDTFPCSILNFVPSFYTRKGRYLSNV